MRTACGNRFRSAPVAPAMTTSRALPALALLAVLLAGCSSGSDGGATSVEQDGRGSAGSESYAAPESAVEDEAAQDPLDGAASAGGDSAGGDSAPGAPQESAPDPAQEAAIIAVGTVDTVADDVAAARRDVQRVTDEAGGQVTSEDTTTDRDGVVDGSRLVLRVPSTEFDATMTALEEIGTTVGATRSLEDVTTQVVDTEARVRAQQASLTRVEALLAEAEDLTEILSIEAELTRRQADLDSLASQLAYLQEATATSTITVYLERADAATDESTDDDGGFLDGLRDGWGALASFGGGLAVLLGVLLPWLLVAVVVGLPIAWVARRRRAARSASPTASPTSRTEGLPPHPGRS